MVAGTQQFTEQPELPQPVPERNAIEALITIDIYLSLAVSLGAAGISGLAIKRVIEVARQVSQRDASGLLPKREQQRVRDLLAQLAILAKADRVALGIFFDGKLSSRGFHFEKMAIPLCYSRPNMPMLPELNKEIDVADIERELNALWGSPTKEVVISKDSLSADHPDCLLYLERRNLNALRLHLLHNGNTELAILGFNFQSGNGELDESAIVTIKRIQIELTEIVSGASLHKKMNG